MTVSIRNWDLGGGMAANRTALPADAGLWPNAILFALGATNTIPAGTSFDTTLYYQAGAGTAGNAEVEVFLDQDFNPYNGNEITVDQETLPETGTAAVALHPLSVTVGAAEAPPGSYSVCAQLTDGGRTRYLYAPQMLTVTLSRQVPSIDSTALSGGVFHCTVLGFPGQQVTMMASADLMTWTPLQTYTLTGTTWEFADPDAAGFTQRFYRAMLNL